MRRTVLPIILCLAVVFASPSAARVTVCDFVAAATADVDRTAPDYTSFEDVFQGTGDRWRSSAICRAYGDASEYKADLSPAGVHRSLSRLVEGLEASTRFGDGNPVRERLLEMLYGLMGQVAAISNQFEPSWDSAKEYVSTEFDRSEYERTECASGFFSSNSVFFADTGQPVVLRIDVWSGGGTLASVTGFLHTVTIDQAIELRTIVSHVQEIFSGNLEPPAAEAAERLSQIDRGWSNYLEKGFSQYPWEVLINSRFVGFGWQSPPRRQWIFAHPEAGALVDARSSEGASTETALLVHGVGHLWYFGRTRGTFIGLSATGSIGNDPAFGAGVGGSLHWGNTAVYSRVPHVSISVMWQDYAVGEDGIAVGVSLDFWRLVQATNGEDMFRAAADRLKKDG